MSNLKDSRTEHNLWEAIAGESQAHRKYLAFADKAEAEGFSGVARLFRAAAAAEAVHATAHLNAVGAVGTTEENLRQAITGETLEFSEMYPAMIKDAAEESHQEALRSFSFANSAEKVHAQLYRRALDGLKPGEGPMYYVCRVCGMIVEEAPGDPCEICNAAPSAFFPVT